MYKPFIENVSLQAIQKGYHYDAGENSMLIRILDPAMIFPPVKHTFRETHCFEFLDVEDDTDSHFGEFAITLAQAEQLYLLLKRALDNYMNVIVHCHAGICRSGAVAEVGIMMGFVDTNNVHRIPNSLVKRKMLQVLKIYEMERMSNVK